jgi:hypothetical protein
VAGARGKIKHMSNLENIAAEFPFIMEKVQTIWPFKHAPWDPGPRHQTTTQETKLTKAMQRAEIRKQAKARWNEQWIKEGQRPHAEVTAPHLRRIINNNLAQGPELYKAMKNRKSCAILAQLRTGHCGLNYYLAKFKKKDSSKCPNCECKKETVEHYLLECEKHAKERDALIRKVGITNMKLSFLLGTKEGADGTLQFVRETGRLEEE